MTLEISLFYRFLYHICETTDRGCATFQKSLSVSFLTLIKRWGERRYFKKIYFFENLISSHNYHNYDTLLKRERQEKLYYLIDT